MTTIFERIINRELPADVLYEDEDIICIPDKFPQAPVHILIITKKVIPSIFHLGEDELYLISKICLQSKELAIQHGIAESYRLLTNHGSAAGQTVLHLHFHLLGGKVLGSKGGVGG